MEFNRKRETNTRGKKRYAVMIKGKVNRFITEKEMYAFGEHGSNKNEWKRFYQFKEAIDPHYGIWCEIGVLPPNNMMSVYFKYEELRADGIV